MILTGTALVGMERWGNDTDRGRVNGYGEVRK